MIKLVASDLDGTLILNGDQGIPEELFTLIKQLKEKNILFVAASGRQYANMRDLFAPVMDDIIYVSENGATAFKDDKMLYCDYFEDELAKEIMETIYQREGSEFCYSASTIYYLCPKTEEYRNLMLNVVKPKAKVVNDPSEIKESSIKLAVFEHGGVTDEAIKFWHDKFGNRCTVVTSGAYWIDFIPFGTNKAKGIEHIRKMYGISADECMAFGDEYNDLEMIKSVKYGFAMETAREGVKAAATYQTPRVAPVLKKLIEKNGNIEEVF